MENRKWNRIKKLFNRALDVEKIDRIEWLKKECGENEQLFNDVKRLLKARHHQSPIDKPLDKLPESIFLPENDDEFIKNVGNYRLIDVIGEGGMGVVYLAERKDGEFEHQVALKLLRFGMVGKKLIRRFKRERQILAKLQHPNIARLFDGGVMQDGTPWFSMEYIDGLPVTEYADKHKLSFDERIKLFQRICDTVHYAHQNLVIHRDLKPSNIMVTEDGEPILLDFGLARIAEEERAEKENITLSSQNWMTLEYAAPEQIKGETLTTATDIYQLGLVLYELLTGRRPYSVKGTTPSEAEKIICNTDIALPSTRFSTDEDKINLIAVNNPNQYRNRLKGDLDTIILKTLEKDPDNRYSSVERLADDLKRHMNGKPIHARPATFAYRAGKFIHRHRKILVAASLLIFTLFALNSHYTNQLAEERDLAQSEAERAEAVKEFMVSMFSAADPSVSSGEPMTVRALLEQNAEGVTQQFYDQPDIAFELLRTIGLAQNRLGDRAQARITLEKGFELIEDDKVDLEPREIADYKLQLSATYVGDSNRKYDLLNRAIELIKDNPDVPLLKTSVSRSLAYLAYARGENERSTELVRSSINNACSDLALAEDLRWCTGSLHDGYFFLHRAGYYEEAFETAEQHYQLSMKHFTEKGQPDRIRAGRLYAISLIDRNRPAEATEIIKLTMNELETYSGSDDMRMHGLITVLGYAQSAMGKDQKAIDHWIDVLDHVLELPSDAFNRSVQLNLTVDHYLNLGKVEEAKNAYATYVPDDEYISHQAKWGHRYNEVRMEILSSRPEEMPHHRWLDIVESFEDHHDSVIPNLKVFALENAIDRQDLDSARFWFNKISNMDSFDPYDDRLAILAFSRYWLFENNLPKAEELIQDAIDLYESREEMQGPRLARLHAIHAEIYCRKDELTHGVDLLEKAEREWNDANGNPERLSDFKKIAGSCT